MLAVDEDSGCSIRSQINFWYLKVEAKAGLELCLKEVVPAAAVVCKLLRGVLLHLHTLILHLLVYIRQLPLISTAGI